MKEKIEPLGNSLLTFISRGPNLRGSSQKARTPIPVSILGIRQNLDVSVGIQAEPKEPT